MKIHALPYWPPDADLSEVKSAFLGKREYMVQPVEFEPGTHQRVLCVGERPPIMVDHAMLTPKTPILEAVDWVVYEKELSQGPATVAWWLSQIMGGTVREVEDAATT